MRKFMLITAMVLVSATAHASGPRSLTLASSDEPAKAVDTKPAEVAPADAPKYVERPAAVDTQPATQCQPAASTTADTPKVMSKDVATTEKPKRRHVSTESRIISELHRHGIYW